jgi:hypothetical protein
MIKPTLARKNDMFTAMRNYLVRSGMLRLKPKHVVREAGRIARDDSIEAVMAFLEKFGNEDQKRASHLLRANAAQSGSEWQKQMNAFLSR